MSINQKIAAFYQSLRIDKKDFAIKVGIPQTTLHNFLMGTSTPNSRIIMQILAAYPNLSAEWLLRGEGDMLLNSINGIELPNIVMEDMPVYGKHTEDTDIKVSIIETEKELYEQIIQSKNEIIESKQEMIDFLKAEIERLKGTQ